MQSALLVNFIIQESINISIINNLYFQNQRFLNPSKCFGKGAVSPISAPTLLLVNAVRGLRTCSGGDLSSACGLEHAFH